MYFQPYYRLAEIYENPLEQIVIEQISLYWRQIKKPKREVFCILFQFLLLTETI
jgi:hypothetical protein